MTDPNYLGIRYTEPLTVAEYLRYAIEAAISAAEEPPTVLPPGEKLYPVLGVGRNQVFDAYRLLSDSGLVTSARGAGTTVNPYSQDHPDIIEVAQDLVDRSHPEGIELPYLQALLAHLWPAPAASPQTTTATPAPAPVVPVPESEPWPHVQHVPAPAYDTWDGEDFS